MSSLNSWKIIYIFFTIAINWFPYSEQEYSYINNYQSLNTEQLQDKTIQGLTVNKYQYIQTIIPKKTTKTSNIHNWEKMVQINVKSKHFF